MSELPEARFAAAAVDFYLHVSSPEENDPLVAAQWIYRRRSTQRFFRHAILHSPARPLRICDVGFGDGALLFYCLRRTLEELEAEGDREAAETLRSAEIVTLDVPTPWPERLRHALAHLGVVHYDHVLADLAKPLPFDDGSLDVVVCTEVVEHLRAPEHYLADLHRVVRPGGFLILTTPNEPSLPGRAKRLVRRGPAASPAQSREEGGIEVYGHVSCKPTEDWERLLDATGFEIERFGLYRVVGNPSWSDPRADRPLAVGVRFALAAVVSLLPARARRRLGVTVELLARRR